MKGWVYVITNKAMPDLLKIGYTTKDPELRANELNTTGVPHRYVVEYDALVNDPYLVEQKAHKLLKDKNENKEWFRCDVNEAIITIRTVSKDSLIHESIKNSTSIQNHETHTTPINSNELIKNKLGDILLDGSIVFFVDALFKNGVAAQPKDEIKRINWQEAKLLAGTHGQDWRLPTQEELNFLFKQKKIVGGFVTDFVSNSYWSSTECNSDYAWKQNFSNGKKLVTIKNQICLVRAVRTFTNTQTTKPIKLTTPIELPTYSLGDSLPDNGIIFYVDATLQHGMAAYPIDEYHDMSWMEAKRFTLAHGKNWRLPTKEELALLYEHRKIVGGFSSANYWSSSEYNKNYAWHHDFSDGTQNFYGLKGFSFKARKIRDF